MKKPAKTAPRLSNPLSNSKGFTLMELMIVLAVIGLVVVMALPRMAKAPGRAKMTDAIGSLGALAAQVDAKCAVSSAAVPVVANMQAFVSSPPSGYAAATYGASPTCSAYTIIYAPSVAGSLPTLCITRAAAGTFSYNAVVAGSWNTDDIPANIAGTTCS